MKNLWPSLLLLAVAGCEAPDIPDIPPLSLGAGGVSFMDQGRTPREAYDTAYSRLTSYHVRIRTYLTNHPVNTYGAAKIMGQIVDSLVTMRSLTVEPWKSGLDPYIQWYRQAVQAVDRNSFGGSYETQFSLKEREIKRRFNPTVVDVLAEFPNKAQEPAAKPPEPAADPAAPSSPAIPEPIAEPVEPPAPTVPLWMAFNAWKQSHAALVDAYSKKQDCSAAWQRLAESLAALSSAIPPDRRQKLSLCEATYRQQHEETKGFTQLPPGGREEDVLRVLRLAAEILEAEYNTNKK